MKHKNLPAYSGKQIVRLDFFIFSSNKSFLFRKRMIDVSVNHLLLHMESNNFILSIIRFYNEKIKQHMRALCVNSVKSMKARILLTNFMKTVVYRVIKIPNNHGLRMVQYILPYKFKTGSENVFPRIYRSKQA